MILEAQDTLTTLMSHKSTIFTHGLLTQEFIRPSYMKSRVACHVICRVDPEVPKLRETIYVLVPTRIVALSLTNMTEDSNDCNRTFLVYTSIIVISVVIYGNSDIINSFTIVTFYF